MLSVIDPPQRQDDLPLFRLRLEGFKALRHAKLMGVCSVTIEAIGLTVDDVHLHRDDSGKLYALPPSRPQLRPDGTVIRRADGRIAYTPLLRFSSRAHQDAFSSTVVALVGRHFPEALS
jgi:hypothetical protein